MQLSQRLSIINTLINEPYDVIWDGCCDHGQLGIAILKRNIANAVMFVDIVPALMVELNETLTRFADSQTSSAWQVLCQDVGAIKLQPNKKQLVIIAGVGGQLMLRLIQQIVANHESECLANVNFILCPVHHTYHLRTGLRALKLGLITEQIVVENKRAYEVLQLSFASKKQITQTGDAMWDFSLGAHGRYVKKLITHYTLMMNQNKAYYKTLVSDYQQLFHDKSTFNE